VTCAGVRRRRRGVREHRQLYDGSTTRTHTVITPEGNFNFSQQETVVLGADETLNRVGAANFNDNRGSGVFTEPQHFSGANVGAPANVVMHSNFGPNGVTEFCRSNADRCPQRSVRPTAPEPRRRRCAHAGPAGLVAPYQAPWHRLLSSRLTIRRGGPRE
jgi:hypothetical protein